MSKRPLYRGTSPWNGHSSIIQQGPEHRALPRTQVSSELVWPREPCLSEAWREALWGHSGLVSACPCPHSPALGSIKLDTSIGSCPSPVFFHPVPREVPDARGWGCLSAPPATEVVGWVLSPEGWPMSRAGAAPEPLQLPCSWLRWWDGPWLPALPWHDPHHPQCPDTLLQRIRNETAAHLTCLHPVHELTIVVTSKLNKCRRIRWRWELLNYFQLILVTDILRSNLVSWALPFPLSGWHWVCFGFLQCCLQKKSFNRWKV